jgi:lipopolysaccharide/colanic/teichoic acid biosynthesis glycosyltransferase
MNWGHPNRDKVSLFLGDMALIALAAVTGWYLPTGAMSDASHKVLSLLVVVPTFLAAMYVCNLYNLAGINGLGTFVKVMVAAGAASAFCEGFYLVLRWKNATYYWSLGLCTVVVPAATYAWRRVYSHSTRRLRTPEKLVVVGSARDAEILSAAMDQVHPQYSVLGMLCTEAGRPETEPQRELTAAAVVDASVGVGAGAAVAMARETEMEASTSAGGVADLGPATSENLLRVVAACDVKVVVVRNEAMTLELAGVLTRLRFSGIQVYSLLDFCMRASEEIPLEIVTEFWLSVADGFDLLQARFFRRLKRLSDLCLASVGLVAALPFMLLAAAAIRLDSPGPVLFRQRRVGWKGQPFELLKFRSMHIGAERNGGPQWAALDDPRVTAVGRILRKTHFDELPQMINVLRGQMSFVGPRPERPEFAGLLSESITFYHLRHYVLPGITGWAQVNYPYGASLDDARRKLQYDLYYVCNASPLLDLRTFLLTTRVVLFRQGSR